MDRELDTHAKAAGAAFEPTRAVFDLGQADRDVFDAVAAKTPSVLEAMQSVRNGVPLPKSSAAGIDGHFYRLPNHNRSYCYALVSSGGISHSPVLVFKGTEPLLPDFGSMLDWMAQAPLRKSSRVMADHFPLAEGKIPGALSLKEALREAEVALHIQKRHLASYGELARIPTPLLVHSFLPSSSEACISTLERKLHRASFDRIVALARDGLAIYVYYYPAAPVRANYWGDMGMSQFRAFLAAPQEDEIITSWIKLLVRLLYLGYLPYSVRNEGLGACMDFGNATLDGGFCDPDSITAIEPNTDDEFFRESVIRSLAILQNTIQMFLGLSVTSALYANIEEFACRHYVQHAIRAAVQSERRPGLELDERFVGLLTIRTVADIKRCVSRRARLLTYTQFAKRNSPASIRPRGREDGYS